MNSLLSVTDTIKYTFSTPIYSESINNFDNIQKEFYDVLGKVKFNYKEEWGNTHYLSDPSFNENIFEKYNLFNFKKELDNHLHSFIKHCNPNYNFEENDYYISSSWFAKFKKNNYGHIHSHNDADIAGVYYIDNPAQKEVGQLFIDSPVVQSEGSFIFKEYCTRINTNIPTGGIILFPGFLKHGITTNITDKERISFSFNIIFKKII